MVAAATLGPALIDAFRASLRGALLRPGGDGYDAARQVWNGMIDRRPDLIARCAGAADVIAAVTFARTHGLVVSVRGGGHNVTGNAVCDRGLMIDLSPMKGIRVGIDVFSIWLDPAEDERHLGWGRAFGTALGSFSRGVYVNEMGNEGEERIRAAYNPATFDRLARLKRQYDPSNFFHLNQNIKPAARA